MRVLTEISTRTYISEYVVLISVDASYLWGQDKRIKIQANYECLQARHSCKAQGEMRAKPDMKPWVNTYKTKKSSDEERHFRREYLSLGVPPLKGLKKMYWLLLPRACALGYEEVSSLWGSSTTSFRSIHFMRPLHNTALAALLSTLRLGHLQE